MTQPTTPLARRRSPTPLARAMGARLRAADPAALHELTLALKRSSTIDAAAQLMGFCGASSLWRIAYSIPEVHEAITTHGPGSVTRDS